MLSGHMRERRLKIFFDGGCRPNPGRMETAVVARGVTHYRGDLGHGTNNDAEWLALIHALEVAIATGATAFELVGDAALVINQANGVWKCRSDALRGHLARFAALAAGRAPIRIRHVGRSQNLAGIALAARHR